MKHHQKRIIYTLWNLRKWEKEKEPEILFKKIAENSPNQEKEMDTACRKLKG